MAKKMRTDDGKLKPFSEWKKDIKSIASHYCGAWLQTEYSTATLRAKFAAEWKQYEADADIMPNLRWMPTTSVNPEEEHKVYWMNRLTLPVGDRFWDKHHPGDHWNCKCSLEQTDEPANPDVLSHIPDVKAQKGLASNPGKTGEMFDRSHPYYEQKCSKCWVNKNKSFKDVVTISENCNKCPYMDNCIDNQKKDYYEGSEFGKRLLISHNADLTELESNARAAKAILRSFDDVEIRIRPHVKSGSLEFDGVKNPEYLINGSKGDRKGIKGTKGVSSAFKKAKEQGCSIVVIDLDEHHNYFKVLRIHKLASEITHRYDDFHNDQIKECYVVYNDKAVRVHKDLIIEDKKHPHPQLIKLLDTIKE